MLFILIFNLLLVKHGLADYLFQTSSVSRGKRLPFPDGIFYLFIHSIQHWLLTFVILVVFGVVLITQGYTVSPLILLWSMFDGVSHFILDRTKIQLEKKYPQKALTIIDQIMHVICYVVIALGIEIAV